LQLFREIGQGEGAVLSEYDAFPVIPRNSPVLPFRVISAASS
jgi:hypothetical protein